MTLPYLANHCNWPVATLEPDRNGAVILEAASGSTPETEIASNWGGPIPWLTPKEITDLSTSYRIVSATERTLSAKGARGAGRIWEPRTVMLTKRAPVGAVVINSIPMTTNQGFMNFRCGERLLPEYLYYWLKANKPYLDAVANGSTYAELYASDLFEFEIALPPIEQQAATVSLLSALDDKIELNRRMNETFDLTARAIFKDWFVDFGPTRAKMEGRAPYLASQTWSLFPDQLDNEGKPEGWQCMSLRSAASVLSGGTPAKDRPELWSGSIPWISPKVMTALHVSDADDRVSPQAIGQGTRIAPSGSVLVMVRGMGLHQGMRISQARRDVAFNQDVKALVPKLLTGTHLLFGMLNAAPLLFSGVESSGHGTGKLPTELLDSIRFTTPTGDAYGKIIQVLELFNERVEANSVQGATLAAVRDLLLPRLISGEVCVKGAEKIAEMAA